MKTVCYYLLLFLLNVTVCNSQTGCLATDLESQVQGFVCSDQIIGPYNNGIYKIRFNASNALNVHTISTVGETDEDTELYLYDDQTNSILAYNDDDNNCGGCKQSTISYYESMSSLRYFYVIIAKKGCNSLTLPTGLKFNSRNMFNIEPRIISPVSIVQCVGNTVLFTYDDSTTSNSSPWSSLTPEVVIIDPKTGFAQFLTTGIAKIQLSGDFSCTVQNNYIVKGSLTSSINH